MAETSIRIVAVSGSLHEVSSTTTLVTALAAALADRVPAEAQVIELARVAPGLAGAISRESLSPTARSAIEAVEQADVLIVGTPVYRASFTGLFKHFFDFVDQYALVDTPVLLAATGGSQRHALAIEHQLRPLFSFFQALTLPIGVYGARGDIDGGRIVSSALAERVDTAAERALPFLASRPVAAVPTRW